MHIKVKEQEFEEGAVGYSLDVPIIRSSHLMQEIIHLGFEPNKVINMAYCALKTEYANKPMDSLQILELIDDNGKSVLEFSAESDQEVADILLQTFTVFHSRNELEKYVIEESLLDDTETFDEFLYNDFVINNEPVYLLDGRC